MAGVYGPLLARKTEYHVSGERACKVGDTERIEYFIGKRVRIMSGWSVVGRTAGRRTWIEAAGWTAWVATGIVTDGVLSKISGEDVK